MTPPPSDADKPGPGGQRPAAAPLRPVQPAVAPGQSKPGAPSSTPSGAAQAASAAAPKAVTPPGQPAPAIPPKPATDPGIAGKPGEPKPVEPKTDPAQAVTALKGAQAADAPKPSPAVAASASPGPTRSEPSKPASPSSGPQPMTAGGPKAEPAKTEPVKTEPGKPGQGAGPQSSVRPLASGGAPTDGPIIDLKASRVPDPPGASKEPPNDAKDPAKGPLAGAAPPGPPPAKPEVAKPELAKPELIKPEMAKPEPAKPELAKAGPDRPEAAKPPASAPTPASSPASTPPPPPAATVRAGFGSLAAAGLVGGVIGAGLLFAVGKAGGDGTRLAALDQKLSGQVSALDQRVGGLAPRDALAGLDTRIAAAEALARQALDKESLNKQALDTAGSTPGAAPLQGQGAGQATAPASVPADLAARLDSLEQRVAALQEEPGRDQPEGARVGVAPSVEADKEDAAKGLAALDARVKALEGGDKASGTPPASDTARKVAALQDEVAARTRADAEAGAALGQRIDGLQQALDARLKVATDAVQASRVAAEAGQARAAESAKAVDRRLQEQADKIAALDKDVARRAEAGTVQAALRVVVADRVSGALASGGPYAEPLASLRRLDPGAEAQAAALAPFAEAGAPTAARLADAFRPIADRIAAKRRAARAQATAETGDFRARLLSMADGLVQVRRVDAPAPETPDAPEAGIQAALERGDVPAASAAFAALSPEAQGEAGDFGRTLKARAQAEAAARTLLTGAFQALPAPAAPAPR